MRTEKELWEVVLNRPDLFDWGLCVWLGICHDESVISYTEYMFLDQKLRSLKTGLEKYWIGPKGQIQPRIDWIKNRIEQL